MPNYNEHIKLRVTGKMLNRIDQEADHRGVNRSEFVRFAIEQELPEQKIQKEENNMESIINDYVSDELLEQASEVEQDFRSKGFDRDYIRIGIHATGQPNKREDVFFVSPGGTIDNGPVFHSQGDSHYRNQNVGDIQISIIYGYEFTTIRVDRIIQPADEDMTYSDDFQEALFPELTYEDRKEQYLPEPATLAECTECGNLHLMSQEKVENGEYTPLNEQETEIICSGCAGDHTVGEYLDSLGGRDKEKAEGYLLDICQLEKDDPLVLQG